MQHVTLSIRRMLLLVAGLSGCGPIDQNGTSYTARDSAGVTVVEVGAFGRAPRWSLSAQPTVSIGTAEGDSGSEPFRANAALRLESGSIVVADGGSREVRFFDEDGTHTHSVGGRGEGPGEYAVLGLLGRYGADSLVTWDPLQRRVTVLDIRGAVARTVPAPNFGDAFPLLEYSVGDGSFIGRVDEDVYPEEVPPGILETDATYIRLSSTGDVDTISVLFGGQSYVTAGRSISMMTFAPMPVAAGAPGVFYYASTRTYQLRRYSLAGQLTRIIRFETENAPLSESAVDMYVDLMLSRIEDPSRLAQQTEYYATVPFPETLPSFSDLRVDTEGNLWVAEYRVDSRLPFDWTVLRARGSPLARITTPAELRVSDVGPDYVLGVQRDSLNVEHVVLYDLQTG